MPTPGGQRATLNDDFPFVGVIDNSTFQMFPQQEEGSRNQNTRLL